ncbi:hypothetical protein MJO29_006198 [Puccinia striiformis f. sp. tritici]|uniref:RWD domain-containing protein n=2 Tax=Puccinia striiformis TaxID=27350 RepID=A0A0L0VL35_9BASI|nr:hypothetical protein Pst134EA_011407 [Puccinia striiformis f. sp. tritici]KNE99973.1 hypothetical protein PSTG_06825 [Puccinia striiformis f. sp. tritici PST-78]POW16208.1 hypothetical protein PSHT_06824 [Puccinia striiformis]KAH9456185.1 hypothetical protein Pst134EB_012389 [Puccinia striiformis f. sp. tritici]KAH9467782.1 hypothetical protein Pst134EA_011407 [Puccinia striiformis f. sp. tritici]KAI7957981.1 hypothetical protein MJO29_006198 [Puccinia striiformis f. sp. tritici]
MQPPPRPVPVNDVEEGRTGPISRLVDRLERSGSHSELADELSALVAILGDESMSCDFEEVDNDQVHSIFLIIDLDLDNYVNADTQEDTHFQLRLDIPDGYPSTEAKPRLKLLAKYLGSFRVDQKLLGSIVEVFEGQKSNDPILYEGIETAKEIVAEFYQTNLDRRKSSNQEPGQASSPQEIEGKTEDQSNGRSEAADRVECPVEKVEQFVVHTSEPIVDRKSVFIGHSISLNDPKDVPRILQHLLSDKKIAKASHNMIAWRCETNGFLHQDNDDDGESAAGSRMQHLLNILDVKNVFVCVSRWFGGIHLGSDRFKHINQATRDALIQGRFISLPPSKNSISSKSSAQQASTSGSKNKR